MAAAVGRGRGPGAGGPGGAVLQRRAHRREALSARVWLFDLDGTLADSAPSILTAMRAAFAELGLPPMPPDFEREAVGPPWSTVLPALIGAERTPAVVAAYRRHYTGGLMFGATLYDGITDVVSALTDAGATLAVATSKPEEYATRIVGHLGLAPAFATVCGDGLAGERGTKAAVVTEALRRLGRPDPAEVVMVGDRSYDVVGAAANSVGCLGAGWGYGVGDELVRAGALSVFATPADLGTALPGLLAR